MVMVLSLSVSSAKLSSMMGKGEVVCWHRQLLSHLASLCLFGLKHTAVAKRVGRLCHSTLSASRMHSNAWTTVNKCKYLNNLIPKFLSVQERRGVGAWLASTATEFLKKFPLRTKKFNRESLTKVRANLPIPRSPLISPTDIAEVMHLVW